MSALPVSPVVLPACLKGQPNGKIDSDLLVPCGVQKFRMAEPAARAMKALVAAAENAGHQVRATGTYRSYDQQVALFDSRYTTKELPGRPTKKWNGVTYWQLPKTAMAAVPGTSNHGLGLAIDFAEELDGDAQVESVSEAFVAWLIRNAATYGYSAEAQSEPWHWRYVAGDATPAAVLAFEGGVPSPQPTPGPSHDCGACARKTVRFGAKGECVRKIQQHLANKGFDVGPADGAFGKKTLAAVKAFQKANGLVADGVVGPRQTWPALCR